MTIYHSIIPSSAFINSVIIYQFLTLSCLKPAHGEVVVSCISSYCLLTKIVCVFERTHTLLQTYSLILGISSKRTCQKYLS